MGCYVVFCCVLCVRKGLFVICVSRKYFLDDQVRKEMIVAFGTHVGKAKCVCDFVWNPYGQRMSGIRRIGWESGFKMCLKEIRSESVDRIYVTEIWEQVTICCENGKAPTGSKNYGELFTVSGTCRFEKNSSLRSLLSSGAIVTSMLM